MASHHSLDGKEHLAQIRRRANNEAATPDTDISSTQHPMLNLQRQIGNAQIARMMAQRTAEEEQEEGGAVQAMHDTSALQRTTEEEQEEGGAVQAMHDTSALQRTTEEEQEEGGTVQAKPEVGLEGGPISADLGGRIQSKRGSGSPLDDGTRDSMEGAFGTSFKDVRIHTDSESQQLNRSISAKAFTTGNDIFFGDSASPADTKLLGHELTHVVQQRSMSSKKRMQPARLLPQRLRVAKHSVRPQKRSKKPAKGTRYCSTSSTSAALDPTKPVQTITLTEQARISRVTPTNMCAPC
jgi:hypothetical protein